jgi:ferric hydroxamate transport system substrate-binding protein
MTPGLTRDRFLAALLLAPAYVAAPGKASPAAQARLVALDWGLASTLIALGLAPVGVAEPDLYRHWVREPPLPAQSSDVGLRVEPNLEVLTELAPDFILISQLSAAVRPMLERIAPVLLLETFTPQREPLERSCEIVRELGRLFDREARADAVLAGLEAGFDAARLRLAEEKREILLVSFVDGRHVNVYGVGSLFADVLARVELTDAWTRSTNVWGISRVPIESLAAYPEADVVVLEPTPPEAARGLSQPGLWASLIEARPGRVVTLPPVWAFGDVCAAERFAGLLAAGLSRREAAR